MKLQKKNNIDFLENGGCFLYYFSKNPKCILTMSLIDNDNLDIFDDMHEQDQFLKHDCQGNIKACPFLYSLWETDESLEEPTIIELDTDTVEYEPEVAERSIEAEIVAFEDGEVPLLKYGPISVDFEYSWPHENPVSTDALVIPTNTILRFENFVDFGTENNTILFNECKKRQTPFDVGDCVLTHGANTIYPRIAHAVIMKTGQLSPDVMSIGTAVYNTLVKIDDEGCQSIALTPLTVIDHDVMLPSLNIYLKSLLISIKTFVTEYEVENLKYILIYIPPNFVSNLQDVIHEVDNIA